MSGEQPVSGHGVMIQQLLLLRKYLLQRLTSRQDNFYLKDARSRQLLLHAFDGIPFGASAQAVSSTP